MTKILFQKLPDAFWNIITLKGVTHKQGLLGALAFCIFWIIFLTFITVDSGITLFFKHDYPVHLRLLWVVVTIGNLLLLSISAVAIIRRLQELKSGKE